MDEVVKRFDCESEDGRCGISYGPAIMAEYDDGDYVEYRDYEKLLAEFKRLEDENLLLKSAIASALKIEDLWYGGECSEEHKGEMQALSSMRNQFIKVLGAE